MIADLREQQRSAPILLVALASSLILGSLTALTFSSTSAADIEFPMTIMFVLTMLLTATAIILSSSRLRWRHPMLLVIAFLLLVYVVRPAYVFWTGSFGTPSTGLRPTDGYLPELGATLAIVAAAIVLFFSAYALVPSGIGRRVLLLDHMRVPRPRGGVLLVPLFAASALAAISVGLELLASPAGWQAALTLRHQFFEGRTWLIWIMELYKFGLLAWLAAKLNVGQPKRFSWIVLAALWVPTLALDAIAGSRAELLVRNVLPFAAVVSWSPSFRHRSIPLLLALVVTTLILFVSYRAVVRDSAINDVSPTDQIGANFQDVWSFVVAGDEAASFDYLTITRLNVPTVVPYRGGDGILAVVAAPLPSAWLEQKPQRAGLELTRLLFPSLFARGGNLAFSGASDLYYIGGDAFLLLGFAGLGLIAGALMQPLRAFGERITSWGIAVGFVLAGSILSVLRADFNELMFVFVRVGVVVVFYALVTAREARSARSS